MACDLDTPEILGAAPPAPWNTLFTQWDRTLQYLYFMRFSLLTWLALLLLPLVDLKASAMTRGILAPFNGLQWFWSGFTVTLAGWFALLAARINCSYGHFRFGVHPPDRFRVDAGMSGGVFWSAQIPGFWLLLWVMYRVVAEEEGPLGLVLLGLCGGVAGAAFFWFIVAVLYHWTVPPTYTNAAARALLVPHYRWLHLEELRELETGALQRLRRLVTKVFCRFGPGYEREPGILHGGHWIGTLLLLCALIVYTLLMPVIAPAEMQCSALLMHVLAGGALLYVAWYAGGATLRLFFSKEKSSTAAKVLTLTATLLLLVIFCLLTIASSQPYMMPVLGIVVLLLAIPFWGLAGLAFFLDRWRVPVLGTVFTIFVLLNLVPQEHVFPVERAPTQENAPLPTPAEILEHRLDAQGDRNTPLIVVAATGGGIHSAAWTAAVLAELERQTGGEFHKQLLLISSVSGGSVASMQFLREYERQANAFNDAFRQRMITSARCSSLQAVAWGLAYPDAVRLIFPFADWAAQALQRYDRGWALEWAFHRNQAAEDCYKTMRNQTETKPPDSLRNENVPAIDNSMTLDRAAARVAADPAYPAFAMNSTVVETGDRFRLANYSVPVIPVGDKHVYDDNNAAPPAAGFLEVFGRSPCIAKAPDPHVHCDAARKLHEGIPFADMSMFTAARLSAAFTYVSPAERVPYDYLPAVAKRGRSTGFHLVDGGYYDNDGVSSVIEFLASALAPCIVIEERKQAASSGQTDAGQAGLISGVVKAANQLPLCDKLKQHPVLLIEIRDSDDIDTGESPDSFAHQANRTLSAGQKTYQPNEHTPGAWGTFQQLLAPPLAAIYAGFDSSTLRNRRELDLLRHAAAGTLNMHHIVVDYRRYLCNEQTAGDHACPAPRSSGFLQRAWELLTTRHLRTDKEDKEKNTALSWHLTARQQDTILGLRDEANTCWRVQPAILRHDGTKPSARENINNSLGRLELESGVRFPPQSEAARREGDETLCSDPQQDKAN